MRLINKIALITAILLTSAALNAQTYSASYTYDANGNRISATVIYLSQAPSTTPPIVEEELPLDQNNKLTINIFPNPTHGNLRVELTGATEEQLSSPNNSIRVWDVQGKLLFSVPALGSSNTVDLSGYSNGVYIMQLFFNGKAKDYRIVKN